MDRFSFLFVISLSLAFASECANETIYYIDQDSTSLKFGEKVEAGQCGCLTFSQEISGTDSSLLIGLKLFDNEPLRGFQFRLVQESMSSLDYQWSRMIGESEGWDVWDFKNSDGSVMILGTDLKGRDTDPENDGVFLEVMYKIVKKPPAQISFYLSSDDDIILSDAEGENLLCSYPSIDTPAIFDVNWLSFVAQSSTIPSRFALHPNFPNPFNPWTTINFDIAFDSYVIISVYDIIGRKVTILKKDRMVAGKYSIQWNGLTELGESVSSGIYYIVFTAGEFSETSKMTLLR